MSLVQIQNCCKSMTKFQEQQYLDALVGRRVHWQGTVMDVAGDGTIRLSVSDTLVELKGAPSNATSRIRKGQALDFIAVITKAEDAFIKPGVELGYRSTVNPSP